MLCPPFLVFQNTPFAFRMRGGMKTRKGSLRFAVVTAALLLSAAVPAHATLKITNLVTDDQTANPAQITDPSLVNGWGVSFAPTGPFWVSDNGTGVSTLYSVDPATDATTKVGLTVTIPGDGSVTGQSFNAGFGGGSFNGNLFTFVSEDGTVSGWRFALGSAAEVLQPGSPANVYKGSTSAIVSGHSYLYSANFKTGKIDVMKGDAAAPDLTGNFTDPTLPAGYAPFNVQMLDGKIFVTYGLQNAAGDEEVKGPGNGYVSEFDLNGNFVARIGSGGTLDAPWGLAIAPSTFGANAGDLLVGNFGDGTINIFDLGADVFKGMLSDSHGNPIVIDGLWALTTGNDTLAGSSGRIYFSAGPGDEGHGLFGVISDVPEPATLFVMGGALAAMALRRRGRA